MNENDIPNMRVTISENRVYKFYDLDKFIKDISFSNSLVKTNKKISYYNIPCAFDIETSSFKDIKGNKRAIMYEWTFSFWGYVIYGRKWEEFYELCERLTDLLVLDNSHRLIIYVHNLSFEFQFMRKRFTWEKVFSLDQREPIYALSDLGIEFRCSYILSGYSLATLGKNLHSYKIEKLVGDLDYSKIRHSETILEEKELQYCINDVLVVTCYIHETMLRCGDITKIPLTKTGFVRQHCRNMCLYNGDTTHRKNVAHYKNYRNLMKGLTLTVEQYKLVNDAFMGGFTHANPYFSRGVFHNVWSFDFTSAYPAVMVSEKFPMSSPEEVKIETKEQFNECIMYYCCVMIVEIKGLQPKKDYDNYISVSHCTELVGCVENNGRVYSADKLVITITEQDFFIIMNMYAWEGFKVRKMIRFKNGYLPTPFIKSILDLYKKKTELKGIPEAEQEYMISKENINSCYGMCVTDIARDEIVYNNDSWSKNKPEVNEVIQKYNNSCRRFLYYPWGIWVTAYNRFNLFTGINEFGNDYIYSDTDSIKAINGDKHLDYIEKYNNSITQKLYRAMDYHGLDRSLIEPKNIKGDKKVLGVWEFEKIYNRFKTIGAKRYLTETNGKIELTVSGVNKGKAVPYLIEKYGDKIFDKFDDGLYIPPEATGKLVHTYIDEEYSGIVTDYNGKKCTYHELSGVHLAPTDYSTSLSRKYIDFLLEVQEKYI